MPSEKRSVRVHAAYGPVRWSGRCDRCLGKESQYQTNNGTLCASCNGVLRARWEGLQNDYPLTGVREDYREDLLLHTLADEDGVITMRPSSAQAWMHLVYRGAPADALAALESRQQLSLQAHTVAQILFGAALLQSLPLQDWPRDGLYAPEDLAPHAGVIAWAVDNRSNLAWLLQYGALLLEAIKTGATGNRKATHDALTPALPWIREAFRASPMLWPPIKRLAKGRAWPPVPSHPVVAAMGRAPASGPHRVQRGGRAA